MHLDYISMSNFKRKQNYKNECEKCTNMGKNVTVVIKSDFTFKHLTIDVLDKYS